MTRRRRYSDPAPLEAVETPALTSFVTDYFEILDGGAMVRAMAKDFPGVGLTHVHAIARRLGLKRRPL